MVEVEPVLFLLSEKGTVVAEAMLTGDAGAIDCVW